MHTTHTDHATMHAMRILHAPLDVGGHAAGLAAAERELGHQSDVAVFAPGPFGYEVDIDMRAGANVALPLRFAKRARFLRQALRRYDIFHFNFGQTLLQVRALGQVIDELAIVKRAGKTIVVTYQGCDVRPYESCFCESPRCAKESPYRAVAAARVQEHADIVYHLNPDLSAWLPGSSFLPYANVDPQELQPVAAAGADDSTATGEIVVLHAPTNRLVKGTEHVMQAMAELVEEGLPVRLNLLEGVQRRDVTREIARADIVIDQLMLGWYGGFAVEAMAMGRPVLCSIDEGANPFGDELPIVRATPGNLKEQIRALADSPGRRAERGDAGRRFAEDVHDPRKVAARVLADIERHQGP